MGVNEHVQVSFPALTEDHLALLACEPGAQAAAALPGIRSDMNIAIHGSSVTASEMPMFTPAMAIRPVNTVPNYTQFVGKLKKHKESSKWKCIQYA